MKNIFYSKVLILLILVSGLSSCTSIEEPEMLYPQEQSNETGEYKILDFELSVSNDTETRCIRPETSHSNDGGTYTYNFPSEQCSPNIIKVKFLELMILYDNEILNSTIIIDKSVIQDFTDNEYVKYVMIRNNGESRFLLSLKFKSNLDPSKLELVITAKFPSAQNWIIENSGASCFFQNKETPEECSINTTYTAELCSFYARHRLNSLNDWKTIDLNIIIKRLNSSLWLFTTHPYCEAYDNYISWFSLGLNNERNINNFIDDEGHLVLHQLIINGGTMSTSHRYYIQQDRTELSQYSLYQYSGIL